ncbi:MAG: cytochrome d ubiquinol oxidase subunit II, partial [Propionicimonas sp.]
MIALAIEPTVLQTLWFILIAILWIGYLVLDGFDYGVAMLIPFLGRTEKEKRVIVNTVGPVWDGNQVWLLTAGGATFAAFPGWYATLFSGLYLPLFLVLVGLIIRGISFEYRSKHPESAWRNTFDWMAATGSFIVALVFGVGFANFILGLPVAPAANNPSLYVVTPSPYFWQLFSWFGLLGGVTLVALFIFHGSLYLALKTKGEVQQRASAFAKTAGLVSIGLGAIFLLAQQFVHPTGPAGWVLLV